MTETVSEIKQLMEKAKEKLAMKEQEVLELDKKKSAVLMEIKKLEDKRKAIGADDVLKSAPRKEDFYALKKSNDEMLDAAGEWYNNIEEVRDKLRGINKMHFLVISLCLVNIVVAIILRGF